MSPHSRPGRHLPGIGSADHRRRGTFTFTATETGAAQPAPPANSRDFKVEPYRLQVETKYLPLPLLAIEYFAVTAGSTGSLILSLLTAKGKPVTSSQTDSTFSVELSYLPDLQTTLIPIGLGTRTDDSLSTVSLMPYGAAGSAPVYQASGSTYVNFPGVYKIELTPVAGSISFEPNATAAPSAVSPITIGPYKSEDLVLRATGPKVVTANDDFYITPAIYFPDDVGGNPLQGTWSFAGITVYVQGPGGYLGQSVLAGTTGGHYTSTSGPTTFQNTPTPIGPMFITTPGTYKIYAEVASNGVFNGVGYQSPDNFDPVTATPVTSITPVLIGIIKVLPRT